MVQRPTAVVPGAGSGIGAAVAHALAGEPLFVGLTKMERGALQDLLQRANVA